MFTFLSKRGKNKVFLCILLAEDKFDQASVDKALEELPKIA